ncbi:MULTISPECIES: helix-turn-helix domain-containing protein [Streptomyces]|uniref:helix-turn-helix domain-containing protein n=1 Tax=Streptomyces TaxID=1883 RepID=UPI000F77D2AC|nr:helix-turn-helix transcriptional regulator [Streptomyces sp. WAC05858]RSS39432.1 XRE family transcriptional regulator [Streptomyces sp. WAC05858]WTA79301.1 helix-turn-helix domain-containing protein [Streptomyces antimycoticus]
MQQAPTTFRVNGVAINERRMQAGLSATQLAALVGVTASYIRKLETGVRECMGPGPYILLRAALSATDKELLAPTEDPTTEKE